MSKWIKKGDQVACIAGNDKGKMGEVLSRLKRKVIVQGVNMRKRHMKSRQQGQASQILEMEMPIDISNVRACDSNGKFLKLKVKISKNKTKKLVYDLDGKEKTYRVIKKRAKDV